MSPPRSPAFERSPARHHKADDRGRQILANGQRSYESQEGDDVDPKPPMSEAVDHRPGGEEGPKDTRDDPREIARATCPRQMERDTQDQADPGQDQ